MTRPPPRLEWLGALTGREYVSAWRTIDQHAVDTYAAVTDDRDWLHNDPDRARRDGPFGGPIVQGFLLLGTLTELTAGALRAGWTDGLEPRMGLNYGVDRLRFVRPVPVGSRIRARSIVRDVEEKGADRIRVRCHVTLEREGDDGPAVVAEWLFMLVYD